MSYPWSTAQMAAVARLGDYNANAYNAATNPKGFAAGGHRINFAPAVNDTSTAAGAVKDAADYAKGQADAAAASATDAAASAARLSGSSSTAIAIGSGTKTFTTQSGKAFEAGRAVRVVSAANPTTAFMVGRVASYSGTTLVLTVLFSAGSGSPSDWQIYVEGEAGSAGTLTVRSVARLAPDQAPAVVNAGTLQAAILDIGLPAGMPAGLFYKWSTSTVATDPGNGGVKVGSASLTTATALYLSETDANGVAQSAVIASWDDSTNPTRGQVRIEDIRNPANFVVYNVVGDLVDNGSWNTLPVAYVDKGGTLADQASVRLEYRATGNKGIDGAAGAAGAAATVTFRSTTTGAAGTQASTVNVGTPNAAIIDLTVPRGATGATGPVVATRYNFETTIADGDPQNGTLRFNNAAASSTTLLFIDNVEATGGVAMTAYLDTFDDSTNPSGKGTLTLKDVNDPSKFVLFRVTGAVVDGSGYRKVPVQYVAGPGGFTAGANLGMTFDRDGDKGADGGGAGNVVGPATATDGGFALFSGTTGKLLQSGQAPGALAYKATINNNDWSGAALSIGNGGTGGNTVETAQQGLNLVPGTHVQAYSAKLAALVALTWAANKGVYFTSATAVATYDQTAFGRSLDGATDAAGAQTILQLRPGVEVQAYHANLAALAGLALAADKIAYATGAGALALADFPSFGRSLVAVTSPSGGRTALGLGTAATANTGTTAGSIALLQTGGVFDVATQPQITGGDVAAAAGSAVHTLVASGVTAGSYVLPTVTFDAKGRATAASQGALSGAITTAAGSLVTTLAAGIVTFANLATAAIASAAEILSNTASKLLSVSALWDAHAPVALGNRTGTVTLDMSTFLTTTLTLTGNVTLANPSNPKPGQAGEIVLTQDGTGGRTVSYGSAWKFVGGTPTASTAAGAVDVISYRVISSTLIIASFGKGVA